MLFGRVKGNVFCSGRVTLNEGSSVEGKIYASAFTSLTETDSNFIEQIPKKSVLDKVRGLLEDVTTQVG